MPFTILSITSYYQYLLFSITMPDNLCPRKISALSAHLHFSGLMVKSVFLNALNTFFNRTKCSLSVLQYIRRSSKNVKHSVNYIPDKITCITACQLELALQSLMGITLKLHTPFCVQKVASFLFSCAISSCQKAFAQSIDVNHLESPIKWR